MESPPLASYHSINNEALAFALGLPQFLVLSHLNICRDYPAYSREAELKAWNDGRIDDICLRNSRFVSSVAHRAMIAYNLTLFDLEDIFSEGMVILQGMLEKLDWNKKDRIIGYVSMRLKMEMYRVAASIKSSGTTNRYWSTKTRDVKERRNELEQDLEMEVPMWLAIEAEIPESSQKTKTNWESRIMDEYSLLVSMESLKCTYTNELGMAEQVEWMPSEYTAEEADREIKEIELYAHFEQWLEALNERDQIIIHSLTSDLSFRETARELADRGLSTPAPFLSERIKTLQAELREHLKKDY